MKSKLGSFAGSAAFSPIHTQTSPNFSATGYVRVTAAFGTTPSPCGLKRSEEHTSELQSLMRISYAVFCLKKKNNNKCPLLHKKNTKQQKLKQPKKQSQHKTYTPKMSNNNN